ncbi:tumor necrosis factor receptor superfamily member 9 isoform X3 [Erinaceus europaeus]|uniref:Tumor necrosis factor receptor superfamily member 9 isoform X3 n=1 Tax=Erinaceus europaeus TaxID=9365 RepID=A0ABM3Y8J3_ERIEU|nr:tumor necrosis factor receptor superfamily member 9 isoform X3 [Erinaceus europaeus]
MQKFIMGSGYYNIVATVLLVMNFERTRSIQDPCSICPAGTYCGRNKDQSCIPCPPNSFSSISGQKACNMCKKCEGCKDCEFGKFNDQKHGSCQLWTDCSLHGKSVHVNGTKESDVVCGPTSKDFSPGQTSQVTICFLALTSTAMFFLVLFLVLHFSVTKHSKKKLLYIFKQPFVRTVQTAQEEDACSCRFPEEEEGEREL